MPDNEQVPAANPEVLIDEPETTTTNATETPAIATAPETPASQPAAPSPASPSPFSVREHLKASGIDVGGFNDDQAAADALLRYAREGAQAREAALQYQRQLAALQSQQAQPAQPKAEKPKTILERKPTWDPRWEFMVEQDAITGALKAKPGSPPDIVQKVSDYLSWRSEWQRTVIDEPEKLQEMFADKWRTMMEDRFAESEKLRQVDSLLAQNETWMFQQGQITPAGKLFADYSKAYYDAHKQHGPVDPLLQWNYAYALTYAAVQQHQAAQQQTPPANPQAVNDAHKQAVINKGAGRQPNQAAQAIAPKRGGASVSAKEMLSKAFSENGLTKEEDFEYGWKRN